MTRPVSERALLLLLAALTAIGPVSANLYLPALPAVRDHFDASVAEVQATFSISLLTFAFGMLFWGPWSDRYGRRPALLSGLAILLLGSIACFIAQDLGWLVAGRGILAFGTATGIIVARAIVSDLYPGQSMIKALATLTMVAVLGHALAPAVGGFLTAALGWRSVFSALVLVAAVLALAVWRYLPETRAAVAEPPSAAEMLATAGRLLRMPLFAGCVAQTPIVFSTFLVFISLAPYVMVSALGRPSTEYGMYFVLIATGYFLGNWSVRRFMGSGGPHRMVATGVVLQVVGTLAALGFALAGLLNPLWIFLPMSIVSFGQGLTLPNVTATAVSLAPEHAGVVSSTVGFLQQLVGAFCVQLVGFFPTDTAVPMLTFCAGLCLVALGLLLVLPRVEPAGNHGAPEDRPA